MPREPPSGGLWCTGPAPAPLLDCSGAASRLLQLRGRGGCPARRCSATGKAFEMGGAWEGAPGAGGRQCGGGHLLLAADELVQEGGQRQVPEGVAVVHHRLPAQQGAGHGGDGGVRVRRQGRHLPPAAALRAAVEPLPAPPPAAPPSPAALAIESGLPAAWLHRVQPPRGPDHDVRTRDLLQHEDGASPAHPLHCCIARIMTELAGARLQSSDTCGGDDSANCSLF